MMRARSDISTVMPALVAGIHVFLLPTLPRMRGRVGRGSKQDVDGRDKPGHDSVENDST